MKALRLAAVLSLLAAPSASADVPLSFHVPAQFSGASEATGLRWALLVFTDGEAEARLEGLQDAAAINRVLLATLTGAGLQRMEEFPQANAAITELAVAGGAANIVRLNDTAHLGLADDGVFA